MAKTPKTHEKEQFVIASTVLPCFGSNGMLFQKLTSPYEGVLEKNIFAPQNIINKSNFT